MVNHSNSFELKAYENRSTLRRLEKLESHVESILVFQNEMKLWLKYLLAKDADKRSHNKVKELRRIEKNGRI